MAPFLDSHLHLLDNRLGGRVEKTVEEAQALGVARFICNTCRKSEWAPALELNRRFPKSVIPLLGIHPWYASEAAPGWFERLEELAPKGGGIGEIGLDGLRGDMEIQKKVFYKQLRLAGKLEKPVVIHCVKAWGLLVDILEREKAWNPGLILHSFGGSVEIMRRLLRLGALFSFSALLAAPNRSKLRRVFKDIPLERLLLESDAPDQLCPTLVTPRQAPPEVTINTPGCIPSLYRFAADLRGMELDEFTTALWENGQIFTH